MIVRAFIGGMKDVDKSNYFSGFFAEVVRVQKKNSDDATEKSSHCGTSVSFYGSMKNVDNYYFIPRSFAGPLKVEKKGVSRAVDSSSATDVSDIVGRLLEEKMSGCSGVRD